VDDFTYERDLAFDGFFFAGASSSPLAPLEKKVSMLTIFLRKPH